MKLEIVGVYPVSEAEEPCHLVEWRVSGHLGVFDVGSLRQPMPGEPEENWQAPYDEYLLSLDGRAGEPVSSPFEVSGTARFCFFYHYLEVGVPFETQNGSIPLPQPVERPDRLGFVQYEAP